MEPQIPILRRTSVSSGLQPVKKTNFFSGVLHIFNLTFRRGFVARTATDFLDHEAVDLIHKLYATIFMKRVPFWMRAWSEPVNHGFNC
jgi:hypothetical protein